tara:strand:- start:871 stop:1251 length:381 start_codon:yes stop_codon:yes gene_type:complete
MTNIQREFTDKEKTIAYFSFAILCFIIVIISNENKNVEEGLERKSSNGSVYWNARPNANGRDWYNASESQKQWICDQMASVGNKTSKFWMQFFNSFYISNGRPDQATSSATINEASNLANAASRWQ